MNVGIVGGGPDIEALVAAAAARGDRILPVADPSDRPAVDRLLDETVCDVIAVGAEGWHGAGADLRAETVRLFVQAGRPLVLSQPLELSMLWAYEIDMIRRDSGAIIVPWLPARLHPFVARLKSAIEAGVAGGVPWGRLETVRFERLMSVRTRESVLAALARDVDLVRVLVGEPARLATLGGTDADTAWGHLAVGFSGPDLLPTRWQVSPGGPPGLSITLQYTDGSIVVHAPDAGSWIWSGPPRESIAFDAGATMLPVIDRALAARTTPAPDMMPTAADLVPNPLPLAADWSDAARAIELAETVPRSLSRGRTIDLHREEFSELGTFRGTMASVGCGLVLAALGVLVGATLVGGVAREFEWEFGKRLAGAWPGVVLTALVLFLILQIVPLLVGSDRQRSDARPAQDASNRGQPTGHTNRPGNPG